jgi:fatty acid desaturase
MTEVAEDPFDRWFAPSVDRKTLRGLMKRNDAHGLAFFLAWLVLVCCSGYLVYISERAWTLVPAMVLLGTILSFSYAASHECAHGTAFKTRWLNELIFWITSLVFIEEPLYRRYSHTSHHTYTWFNGKDAQKPYGNPVSWWTYLSQTSGLAMPVVSLWALGRVATGKLNDMEREFTPESEVRKMIVNSRWMLLIYSSLVLWAVLFKTAAPFVYFFIPRILGGWLVNLYINTQHMCMNEDIEDHRYSSNTIRCSPLGRLLYWNMNYHIEHHIFPTVPFHSLPALRDEILDELPANAGGVFSANARIVGAIRRQKEDPGYFLKPVFDGDTN